MSNKPACVYLRSGRSLGVLEELAGRLLFCQRDGDAVASGTRVKGLTLPLGS